MTCVLEMAYSLEALSPHTPVWACLYGPVCVVLYCREDLTCTSDSVLITWCPTRQIKIKFKVAFIMVPDRAVFELSLSLLLKGARCLVWESGTNINALMSRMAGMCWMGAKHTSQAPADSAQWLSHTPDFCRRRNTTKEKWDSGVAVALFRRCKQMCGH